MKLPFLSEVIAESMWRAMGCVCDGRPNAEINNLKQVFRWRSTKWLQSTEAVETKNDPYNHTSWKHMWAGTTVGVSGTSGLLNGPEMKNGLDARQLKTRKDSSLLRSRV